MTTMATMARMSAAASTAIKIFRPRSRIGSAVGSGSGVLCVSSMETARVGGDEPHLVRLPAPTAIIGWNRGPNRWRSDSIGASVRSRRRALRPGFARMSRRRSVHPRSAWRRGPGPHARMAREARPVRGGGSRPARRARVPRTLRLAWNLLVRHFLQHPVDDRRELPAHFGPQPLHWHRILDLLPDQLLRRPTLREERSPGEQEVEGRTEGIEIGADIHVRTIDCLLGGHIVGGAENLVVELLGQTGFAISLGADETQVEDLDHAELIQEKVRGLDVAMDETQFVGVLQTERDLPGIVASRFDRKRSKPPDHCLKAHSLDVLHDQIEQFPFLAEIEDANNVGVVE